jgi:hypothetical protein
MVYYGQVACLIDMADVGDGKRAKNRTQTYKHARPAMKLTAKEDAVTMAIVSEYWPEELAPRKCWAVMEVPTRGVYVAHNSYVNRPAGNYHAVTAMLSHQGDALPPHPPHVSGATLARCIMGQRQGSVRFVSATAASTLRLAGLHQSCWKPSKSLLWTLLRNLCICGKPSKSHMVQTSLDGRRRLTRYKRQPRCKPSRGRSAPPRSNHSVPPRPQPTTGTSQAPGLVDASTPVQPHASA